jgi:hypothetical protein
MDAADLDLELDLHGLLWRTRGRHWDYTFVLRPVLLLADSWYEVHSRIFEGLTPEREEQHRAGTILDTSGECVFVATAFIDPVRRDAAGRPVSHYLVWFRPEETRDGGVQRVPRDWGRSLLAQLGARLEAAFSLPGPGTPAEHSTDDIEGALAAAGLPPAVHLAGPAVEIPLSARLVFEKKKSRASRAPRSPLPLLIAIAALMLLLLALAVGR